jgi:hypothetical protein
MILTDGTHLVSDESLEELHTFAKRLGLKLFWFQPGRHPHYDLTTRRMNRKAVDMGAKRVDSRTLVSKMVR